MCREIRTSQLCEQSVCCWAEKSSRNPMQACMVHVVLARWLRKPLVSFTGLFTSKSKTSSPLIRHTHINTHADADSAVLHFLYFINIQCRRNTLLQERAGLPRLVASVHFWTQLQQGTHNLHRIFCSSDEQPNKWANPFLAQIPNPSFTLTFIFF